MYIEFCKQLCSEVLFNASNNFAVYDKWIHTCHSIQFKPNSTLSEHGSVTLMSYLNGEIVVTSKNIAYSLILWPSFQLSLLHRNWPDKVRSLPWKWYLITWSRTRWAWRWIRSESGIFWQAFRLWTLVQGPDKRGGEKVSQLWNCQQCQPLGGMDLAFESRLVLWGCHHWRGNDAWQWHS